ncbi:MAG: hypothetical protein SFW35_10690 [Chitinophagales bacterium]|nr:hypothetical protein [Chitinophagales bacterium]
MSEIHYQEKFLSLEEAMSDAKAKSKELGTKVAVIQKKRLFYVDTNVTPMDKEELHVVYENGKKSK